MITRFSMRHSLSPLAGVLLLMSALPLLASEAFRQNASLGRGVNMLGWDVIWQNPARSQFKETHFKLIREAGFNHVRLNLHPFRDGQPDASGKLRAEFFQTMDWAVDHALTNELMVILDFHDDLAISPDPAGKRTEFLDAWAALAEHCKDRPDTVLFEILNEPAPKFTHESWDEYWKAALAVIRKTNPQRTVIVGPAQWNGVGELDHLRLPPNDQHLIVTVHYYNPFPFTHQGTPWTGQKDKVGVTWTGTDAEVRAVENDLAKVAVWSKQNDRPIYIGEFGTYEKADMPSRIAWTSHVARQFEKHGWSWGVWQFSDNFAVFDLRNQKWVEPIRDALIPKSPYPPARFPDSSGWGRNIQRTMRLLATSTPEHRNTVRILFYGQSITEQKWPKLVEDDLRRRFPHANLIVENRALGGFASQMLVKTAETDLYPFQPDLLIFHVYGAHNTYEDIIRRTRERTTAEILMQTDHVTKPADFTEETDPAKLPPAGKHWDAFMNHNWLPSLARKYGAELCDQRALWKAYLKENNLEPKALLKDGVHLNAHGEWFMAECVKAYLRYGPKLGLSPAEDWVRTFEVGKEVRWANGKLRLDCEGNRIEVICKSGTAAPAAVRLDGRKPSEFPELYGFTRAVTKPPGKWPVKWPIIAPIGSDKPLLVEDWTLAVKPEDATNDKLFSFTLTGSQTGPDGEGRSDARFVSKSGRVVIETNVWNASYALSLGGIKPVPDTFEVKWKVEPRFVDEFISPGVRNAATETLVTIASGLPNGKHTLEISGSEATPIAAIRVYRPAPAKATAR